MPAETETLGETIKPGEPGHGITAKPDGSPTVTELEDAEVEIPEVALLMGDELDALGDMFSEAFKLLEGYPATPEMESARDILDEGIDRVESLMRRANAEAAAGSFTDAEVQKS
jgi:hypothetical protein